MELLFVISIAVGLVVAFCKTMTIQHQQDEIKCLKARIESLRRHIVDGK
jgi:uncharacterized membrane-anchored protein YhcB (DUF1043 family)